MSRKITRRRQIRTNDLYCIKYYHVNILEWNLGSCVSSMISLISFVSARPESHQFIGLVVVRNKKRVKVHTHVRSNIDTRHHLYRGSVYHTSNDLVISTRQRRILRIISYVRQCPESVIGLLWVDEPRPDRHQWLPRSHSPPESVNEGENLSCTSEDGFSNFDSFRDEANSLANVCTHTSLVNSGGDVFCHRLCK